MSTDKDAAKTTTERCIKATDRVIGELVDDWNECGKRHRMTQLYGLTEKESRTVGQSLQPTANG